MNHPIKILAAGLALAAWAQTAQAAEMSNCEVVVVEVIKAADGSGEMHIQSFRSSDTFIASALDDNPDHITQIEGNKIKGLLCTRNDIIPTGSDYPLLATGIPLSLSQNFDSDDTDSLTVKWIGGNFKYKYEGYPLSDEAQTALKVRLAEFSARGLNAWAVASQETEMAVAEIEVRSGTDADVATDAEVGIDPDPADQDPMLMSEEAESQAENLVILSFDRDDGSDAVGTRRAIPTNGFSDDELDDIIAEVIATGETDLAKATKLNIQTNTEIEE